jgi:DNA transformation protein and related proteins
MTPAFRDYILEQLGRAVPITWRPMFGGVGVYSEGLFFALLDDDLLYFKVDETNRADFERLGSSPFQPYGEGGAKMLYYAVPAELIENPEELRSWALRSIEVARRKKKR